MQSIKISAVVIGACALVLFCGATFVAFAQEQAPAGLSQEEQTRAINLASNLINRHDATIQRFDQIANRLLARIKKMEAEGYQMAASWTQLIAVTDGLAKARTQMAEIDDIAAILGSENPKEAWGTSRLEILAVKSTLEIVKTDLQKAIIELRKTLADGPIPMPTDGAEGTSNAPVLQ